jgi:hypothetical protein
VRYRVITVNKFTIVNNLPTFVNAIQLQSKYEVKWII